MEGVLSTSMSNTDIEFEVERTTCGDTRSTNRARHGIKTNGGEAEGGAIVGDADAEEDGGSGGYARDGDRAVLETVAHLTAAAQTLQTRHN